MKILVAYDGSTPSEQALQKAFELSKTLNSEILILTVIEPMAHFTYTDLLKQGKWISWEGGDYVALEAALRQQHEKIGEELQNKAKELAKEYEYPFSCRLEYGAARTAICEIADTEKADLIIIGSRGLGALKRLLLGSVSSYVVHHAPCSVFIVRNEDAHPDKKH